jgi:hypothetical protein
MLEAAHERALGVVARSRSLAIRSIATSARRSIAMGCRSAIVAIAFSSIWRCSASTLASAAMTCRASPVSRRVNASMESVTCF